jgi:hypothetical protein
MNVLSSYLTGVMFILPCIDKCHRVDMRVKAFNVPPQKVNCSNLTTEYPVFVTLTIMCACVYNPECF